MDDGRRLQVTGWVLLVCAVLLPFAVFAVVLRASLPIDDAGWDVVGAVILALFYGVVPAVVLVILAIVAFMQAGKARQRASIVGLR